MIYEDICDKITIYHSFIFLIKGSIGGPAAILARNCITNVEVLDFEDLGLN